MIQVKFKRFHKDAKIPKQATELAGGWDVVSTEMEASKGQVIYKVGFGLQPPFNYRIILVPRSSITKTLWMLQNSPGLGDADFIHEYQFRFRAFPEDFIETDYYEDGYKDSSTGKFKYPDPPYKVGERIGQIYIQEVIPTEFIEVDELMEMEREGGFGSTGNLW